MRGDGVEETLARVIADRRTVLLVVAHPDDDVLGAGALLARLPRVQIVYVTDGAPRDGHDARAHGFADAGDYAAARRREAREALAVAGVDPERTVWLEVPDQAATFQLERIARRLGDLVAATAADLVLTHPYEGGHPDHDAVAFAVHAALARTGGDATARRPLLEFTGYRAAPAGGREASFLPCAARPEAAFVLSEAERRLKAAMLARHHTQAAVLADFPLQREAFRFAPAYDFSRPPHAGTLLYERPGFGAAWGIEGPRWRREAAAAAGRLGLG
ncbi:MAG TPA: PIG-L family deacetylase [Polyangia bacterium]|nr:PIG-L family deacetylase [Polyangia bacterium]